MPNSGSMDGFVPRAYVHDSNRKRRATLTTLAHRNQAFCRNVGSAANSRAFPKATTGDASKDRSSRCSARSCQRRFRKKCMKLGRKLALHRTAEANLGEILLYLIEVPLKVSQYVRFHVREDSTTSVSGKARAVGKIPILGSDAQVTATGQSCTPAACRRRRPSAIGMLWTSELRGCV